MVTRFTNIPQKNYTADFEVKEYGIYTVHMVYAYKQMCQKSKTTSQNAYILHLFFMLHQHMNILHRVFIIMFFCFL